MLLSCYCPMVLQIFFDILEGIQSHIILEIIFHSVLCSLYLFKGELYCLWFDKVLLDIGVNRCFLVQFYTSFILLFSFQLVKRLQRKLRQNVRASDVTSVNVSESYCFLQYIPTTYFVPSSATMSPIPEQISLH